MKIGFIGAGKVGTGFGMYLVNKGVTVAGYYSRSPDSAREAAKLTCSEAFISPEAVAAGSDMLFITTPDGAIKPVCSELCRTGSVREHHFIGHMSGAFGSDILSEARQLGACVFSWHPLLSFADAGQAASALEEAYFSLEGDFEPARKAFIDELLERLGNPVLFLKPEQKVLYHACACIVSNFLYTLMDEGMSLFEKIGIPGQTAFKAALPLINSSLQNIETLGPALGLTGPLARGDANTIQGHLEALSETGFEENRDFYTYMAAKTLTLAQKEKLKDKTKIDELEKMLGR